MPEAYSPNDAIIKIRSILQTGRLLIRSHCYDQMSLRNVDDLDIRKVLEENGSINNQPEWDTKHLKWKYKVDGYDIEGDKLSVIVNIIENDWIVVTITVF
ncbi:MAG: DUF4258 domain-containing protein [Pyrinomonadaceae bacterium]